MKKTILLLLILSIGYRVKSQTSRNDADFRALLTAVKKLPSYKDQVKDNPKLNFKEEDFNFSEKDKYKSSFHRNKIGLKDENYIIKDFLTNDTIAVWGKDDALYSFDINPEDAILFKLYPVN